MKGAMAAPTDRSLATFKAAVNDMMKGLGLGDEPDDMTPDEWEQAHADYWAAVHDAKPQQSAPAKLSVEDLQARLDALRS